MTAKKRARIRLEVCPQRGAAMPWKLTMDGAFREAFPTQERAIRAARDVAAGLAAKGELVTLKIKHANGKVREERTYPCSSDPRETKG